VAAEVHMTLERGETLLVTLGIPGFLLVFFSLVHVLPTDTRKPVDFLAPGVLALAVMSTAMVSLGIATGFERSYGVLKRLGATPLGRPRLLSAKITAVLGVELVQVVVLAAIALGLGWRPHPAAGLAVLAELLATVAFAGIGLSMAGSLRAEVNLAAVNALYIVLLLIGGVVFPLGKLGAFAAFARVLPAGALTASLHPALGHGSAPGLESWLVLAAWAVIGPSLAALTFKWE
jgi:ABC-2 type transport system permease protein